jgi:hypothetical protein
MTITKKVKEYKAANPDATNFDVAKACNTSPAYVSQILNPKPKAEKVETVEDPSQGQKILRKEINRLNDSLQRQLDINKDLTRRVGYWQDLSNNLNKQCRGLENVVLYLETKLGIDEIENRLEATKD